MTFCNQVAKQYLLWVLLLLPFISFAQTGSITGLIADAETQEPLIGATLLLKGTTTGTVTDFDGTFRMDGVPVGDYELDISYTGFNKVTRQVSVTDGQEVVINAELGTSATQLDLIVVTGTGGPVEKKKIGNTIGSISTKKLEDLPVNSFSDLLQGREPGLVSLPSSGLTGEGAQIRIRGSASLSQLNEPIILIDGIRVDRGGGFGGGFGGQQGGTTSRLDDINPEAIERIEILKGASAATLFGTEASNGVIQIFTKKGKAGKPQFDFKLAQAFINYPQEAFPNNVGFARNPEDAALLSTVYGRTIQPYELISTTAIEDLFETGLSTNVSGSVSGGTETINYFVSARYSDTDGPFGGQENRNYPLPSIETRATDTDRMGQLNLNLNIFPSEKFNIRFTSGYTDRAATTPQNNNNIFGVGSLAQFSKPELARENNLTGSNFATVNEAMQVTVETDVKHYNGSVGINYYPLEWLKLDGTFGVDYSNTVGEVFWPFGWNIDGVSGSRTTGRADFNDLNFLALSGEVKASLNNKISSAIESNFVIGAQLIRQESSRKSGRGEVFPGPGFEVSSAAANQTLNEFFEEVINAGVFVQEQLGFGNSFYLTLGARLDAHSAFGSNFNAQIYPKVSFSYVPSESSWWKGFGPISSLQIRGSYGWAGLQPGAFDALTTYEALPSATGAGIAPDNLGNENLQPEISKEWETGFSAGLFNNRMNLEFTYWDRVVEDALFARSFPSTGGFRATQLVNLGQVEANGLEITVNGTVLKKRDLTIDVFANAAYLQEEVTDLGGAPPLKVGGSYTRLRNFVDEGLAPGTHLGVKYINVDDNHLPIDIVDGDGQPDSKEDLIAWLSEQPANINLPNAGSQFLFADDDGDGTLDDHVKGKPNPDWQGSFGANIKFKRFSLNTTFEYRAGNFYINNLTDAFRQANPLIGRNLPASARVERDYQSGGVDASGNPILSGDVRLAALEEWIYELAALNPFFGLNMIERADFIRWRELSLTYRLPSSFIESLGFRHASIAVAGKNIALFTKYSGVDPEISNYGRGGTGGLDDPDNLRDINFGQGIAAFGWPIPRQVVFTLKLGL